MGASGLFIAVAIWYIGDKFYNEFKRFNDLKEHELDLKYLEPKDE